MPVAFGRKLEFTFLVHDFPKFRLGYCKGQRNQNPGYTIG